VLWRLFVGCSGLPAVILCWGGLKQTPSYFKVFFISVQHPKEIFWCFPEIKKHPLGAVAFVCGM